MNQFGNPDDYTKIVLETIFEVMNEQKTEFSELPVHDQKGQKEPESDNSDQHNKESVDENNGRKSTGDAQKMGDSHKEDYP